MSGQLKKVRTPFSRLRQLLPAESLLAVTLADRQLIGMVGGAGLKAPEVSPTAIAHHGIAHPQIEQAVE
jgi:hypothetical protein